MNNYNQNDIKWLKVAISKSQKSVDLGGFPVGAVIVKNNEAVSYGFSNGKNLKDATLHAEIDAIRKASDILQVRDLKDVVLYSSLEPCVMCFCASNWAYIPRVVYACRRKQVSKQYFEGVHDLYKINKCCNRPAEIVNIKELEDSTLKIIKNWEKSLG